MSNLNNQTAVAVPRTPLWLFALLMLAGGYAIALLVPVFFPSAASYADKLIEHPNGDASMPGNRAFMSPQDARAQKLTDAKTVAHGSYVKDPYGCVYMFQYLSSRLSVTPVLDEHRRPVCTR